MMLNKISLVITGLVFFGLFALTNSINAEEARPMQENVVIEQQVQRLSEELRCLVCQNQTLADSSAPLAEDLRKEVREMATKGMSDKAIIDYLVTRYGDFVRYRPPLNLATALLWIGPFVLLIASAVGFVSMLRRGRKLSAEAPLSQDEARKVAELLKKES
ncbi:MAG: cytochrome c-type biogenesis protein CcmH [Methylophilaceae bacterium]|nr:cytochrome c-type biogenesis protein CcmH [Methylophilaceae bacterium]